MNLKSFFETIKNAKVEKESLTLKVIKEKAKLFKVNILIGSLQTLQFRNNIKKLYNRSFLINSNGKIICRYNKIHMFDANISKSQVYNESKIYQSGKLAKIGEIYVNGQYYKNCRKKGRS